MGTQQTLFHRLRQPEYTGANRCRLCTVANLLIAVLLSLAVGRQHLGVGTMVFILSLLLIYVRGYLIPWTPTLTEKLLPAWVHMRFGTEPTPRENTTDISWDAIDRHKERTESQVETEEFLQENGVLTPAGEGTFKLDDNFHSLTREELTTSHDQSLWTETEPTVAGTDTVADLLGVSPDEISPKAESYPAVRVAARVRQWPSEQALKIDSATHRALDTQTEEWSDVPLEQRLQILSVLRSYQESCPCGGELAETTETIDSCCRSGTVIALVCTSCSEPLLERDPSTTDWFSPENVR